MSDEKQFLQYENIGVIKPGQHGNSLKTLILKNLTFADRAEFFFQLVHNENQDKEHNNENCQCRAQKVHQEKGDFR